MSQSFLRDVDQLIRARYPILYVVTWEEERARQLLLQVAGKQKKFFFDWTITDGLRRVGAQPDSGPPSSRRREPLAVLNDVLQNDNDAVFVLRDFHHYLEAPEIVRMLRDLSHVLRRTRKTLVIVAPQLKLHDDLEKSVTIVDLPLPGYTEIAELLDRAIAGGGKNYKVNLGDAGKDIMIKAALGLTYAEAENAFARAIVDEGVFDIDDVAVVIAEKEQIIRKTHVLEYVRVQDSIANVGGMDMLKDWLRKRVSAFTEKARAYGLPHPKGVLLLGVQGCGKSLIAKTIANEWRMPLLRMDMSRIFESYIGSSEQNMRRALRIAEGIAPVVLWIDEIEKAFSGGARGGDMDGGTSTRVLGQLLTWMQEKTAPVFIVATANQIQGLPPELLRKGRLDEIFFVDLPGDKERAEIFGIHLRKLGRDPARFDLASLANATGDPARGIFSGAEIEQALISALHDSFHENREVSDRDIYKAIAQTVPLSSTMRENVDALRAWATVRARPVSSARALVMPPGPNG